MACRRSHTMWWLLAGLAVLLAVPSPSAAATISRDSYSITRPYDYDPETPYLGGQHRGVDVIASTGKLTAPAAGTVVFSGSIFGTAVVTVASVHNSEPVIWTFAHAGQTTVTAGDQVQEGHTLAHAAAAHIGLYVQGTRHQYLPITRTSKTIPAAGEAQIPVPISRRDPGPVSRKYTRIFARAFVQSAVGGTVHDPVRMRAKLQSKVLHQQAFMHPATRSAHPGNHIQTIVTAPMQASMISRARSLDTPIMAMLIAAYATRNPAILASGKTQAHDRFSLTQQAIVESAQSSNPSGRHIPMASVSAIDTGRYVQQPGRHPFTWAGAAEGDRLMAQWGDAGNPVKNDYTSRWWLVLLAGAAIPAWRILRRVKHPKRGHSFTYIYNMYALQATKGRYDDSTRYVLCHDSDLLRQCAPTPGTHLYHRNSGHAQQIPPPQGQ